MCSTTKTDKPCIFHFGLLSSPHGCQRGNDCPFSHSEESIAKIYCPILRKTNECGQSNCPFSHNKEDIPTTDTVLQNDRPKRKVHYVNNQPILACGVLLWKRTPAGNLYYAIEDSTENGSDSNRGIGEPGGKVEPTDTSPFDTAKREFKEETGTDLPDIRSFSDPSTNCDTNWNQMIFPIGKYLLFIARVPLDLQIEGKGKWVFYREGCFKRISNYFPF